MQRAQLLRQLVLDPQYVLDGQLVATVLTLLWRRSEADDASSL